MEGIHTLILSKIFALDKIPTTIKEWYDKTSRFNIEDSKRSPAKTKDSPHSQERPTHPDMSILHVIQMPWTSTTSPQKTENYA